MGRQLSNVRTPGNRLRGYGQQTTVWQRTTNGQQTTQQGTISLQQFNQRKEISRVRPANNRQLINDLWMTVSHIRPVIMNYCVINFNIKTKIGGKVVIKIRKLEKN